MWCQCGNAGPETFEAERCWTCWKVRWHPDKIPPVRSGPFTFAAAPPARFAKCPKCGAEMSKRVPCVPCKEKSGKDTDLKVCPVCG